MGILGDSRALSRIRFLGAAERVGLLEQVRSPIAAAELAGVLQVSDSGLLEGLLNLGVAAGELRSHGGRYCRKGRRAGALASDGGGALRAFTTELVDYHGEVFRDLSGQPLSQERAVTSTNTTS